ncbi:MAG TPA: beta-propeller fold lactonase family protein [Candidatus Baltobacteraceae bacterium]|jgi:hypothetical protein
MRRTLAVVLLAGCTGNPGPHGFVPSSWQDAGARPVATAASAEITFRIDVPPASGSKRSKFISPSSRSAAIALYSPSGAKRASAYTNLTAGINQRTLRVPVGPYRASINLFDGPLGAQGVPSGHKLSTNDNLPVYVPSYDVTIFLGIYLNGIPKGVRVSAPMAGDQKSGFSLNPCQRFPQIFTLTALDAAGNVIIGPGAPTSTLQSTAGLLVSPAGLTEPNEFIVDADPNAPAGPATLTAAMKQNGSAGNHASTATFSVSSAPVSPDGCLLVGNDQILGNLRNVEIYPPGAVDPVGTMTDGIEEPYAFAFDGAKNLYVANNDGSGVTEYAQNAATPMRTLPSNEPFAVAVDSSGNAYTADFGANTVSVFPPGTSTPSYQIGVVQPAALAFDGSGNLYVGSRTGPISASGTVSVYAPGAKTSSRTLSVGNDVAALVFDHAGNLYVLDYGSNSIVVFAPGASSPSHAIATGINEPRALAVDSSNNLYVANYRNSNVTVYAPGQSTPSRRLSTGINTWAVTVDSSDRLYVGTTKRVLVYAAGSSTPSLVIRNGIAGAITLAVTP